MAALRHSEHVKGMGDRAIASAAFLLDREVGDAAFDFAAASESVPDRLALDREMAKGLEPFGIAHFVLYQAADRMRRSTALGIAGRSHMRWRARYSELGLADEDELLVSGLNYLGPMTWTRFRDRKPETPHRVYDEARTFGLRDGFYLPILQPDGSMLGVSMMVERRIDPDPRTLAALHILALYYALGAQRLGLCPPLETGPMDGIELTPRQKECLAWVAAGKSSWAIGEILDISEHTVNEHLGAARKRLGVHTTTQAVLEAARHKQIIL